MRTTIDLPDPMFRRLKSTAALRGTTMKALIVAAIEREIAPQPSMASDETFPVIRSRKAGSLPLDSDRVAEILEGENLIDSA